MTSVEHMEESSSTSSTSSINSPQISPVIPSPLSSSIPESSSSSPLEADASPPRKKRSWRVLSYYRSETSETTVNNIHFLALVCPYLNERLFRTVVLFLTPEHLQTKVTDKSHQQRFSILHLHTVMSSLRLLFIIKEHHLWILKNHLTFY